MTTWRRFSATLRVLQQLLDEGRNMVSNGTGVKRVKMSRNWRNIIGTMASSAKPHHYRTVSGISIRSRARRATPTGSWTPGTAWVLC
jgi:hypothetical protein